MPGTFELWLTSDRGNRLAQLSQGLGFSGSKVLNNFGWLEYALPTSFDKNLLKPDRMIQLFYQPYGGPKFLWNVYFLRKIIYRTQGNRNNTTIILPDTKELLRRRIVAAYTNESQSKKTDFADDMMKEVMTEALADGVAPTPTAGTRAWANFTVDANVSLGPTISKSFPFDKLLTSSGEGVFAQIANAARNQGAEVFFDVVPSSVTSKTIAFKFITKVGIPGADLTKDIVFSLLNGNLKDPELELDYTEEENYIYAAGQGEEDDRNVQQVYDETRFLSSAWGRIEGLADARNQDSNDSVLAAGYAKLQEGYPKIRFRAAPIDTEGTAFGLDWNVGDKVTALYENIEFHFLVRAVSLSVDANGVVSVQSRFDYES